MISFKDFIKNPNTESFKKYYVSEEFRRDALEEILNEVKLGGGDKVGKAALLLGKVMGKRMGEDFKFVYTETYKRSTGSGKGFRFISENGAQLRFNFDSWASNGNLTSTDYWDASNINLTKPTRTAYFSPKLNIIQTVDYLSELLQNGNAIGMISEKRDANEKKAWLKSHGLPVSLAKSMRCWTRDVKAAGLEEEARIFLGGGEPETNSTEVDLQVIQKRLDDTIYADPDTIFDDIEDLLELIKNKSQKSLIILGQGGIGKTFHVTEGGRSLKTLGPEGVEWTYHSGSKIAPKSFYDTLFQERDKIIVWDEADSLFKNDDIIMMMKPILDTSGLNYAAYGNQTENMVGRSEEEIEDFCMNVDDLLKDGFSIASTFSEKKSKVALPSKFRFTGSMVFISNMKASQMEDAVLSRSIFVDVHLAASDVVKRITSIARAQAKSLGETEEETDELMEALGAGIGVPNHEITYMTPELARTSKELTVRSLSIARNLRKSGLKNWARLAAMYS